MAIRIRDVIGKLTEEGGALGEESVDKLETGDFLGEVEAIATAFMASQQVIERAVALGVNLLITHEGLFYSHRPGKQPAANDPVVRQKRRLIEESGIAVYRFHDGIHRYEPDGIMAGFVEEAGWEAYVKEYQPAAAILSFPDPASRYRAAFKNQAGGAVCPLCRRRPDGVLARRAARRLPGRRRAGDSAVCRARCGPDRSRGRSGMGDAGIRAGCGASGAEPGAARAGPRAERSPGHEIPRQASSGCFSVRARAFCGGSAAFSNHRIGGVLRE